MICRCRFDSSTTSNSTMPKVPTPAAARYISAGDPSPPAPTHSTLAFLSRFCPAMATSGMIKWRLYRRTSSTDRDSAGSTSGGNDTTWVSFRRVLNLGQPRSSQRHSGRVTARGDRSGAGLLNARGIRGARRVGPRIGLASLAVRRLEADRLLHHDRREPVLEAGVGVTMAKRMPGLVVDHVQVVSGEIAHVGHITASPAGDVQHHSLVMFRRIAGRLDLQLVAAQGPHSHGRRQRDVKLHWTAVDPLQCHPAAVTGPALRVVQRRLHGRREGGWINTGHAVFDVDRVAVQGAGPNHRTRAWDYLEGALTPLGVRPARG